MEVTLMDSRLCNAAMSGNVTDLIRLVVDENRPEILNQVTPQRNTTLHIAAKRGHVDFVKTLLLLRKCILLCLNSKRENALHVAATSGKLEVVKVLLESESDATCGCGLCVQSGVTTEVDLEKNVFDRLCVWRAQKKNLLDGLYFRRAPKNFWRAQNLKKNTALHLAAKEGHPDIVNLLLMKDQGLASLVNAAGQSPLFIAAENGHLEILSRLSEAYPAPCDTDYRRQTALHAALRQGHSGVAKELLEKRAELAERADESGSTPLHLAAAGGHLELVTLILQNHPKACGAANGDGTYAVHIASQAGDEKIVRELLRWNPDSIELLDRRGKTALQVAIESGHRDVARYLSENSEYFSIKEPEKEVGGDAGQPSAGAVQGGECRSATENETAGQPSESHKSEQQNNRLQTVAIIAGLLATVTFTAAFTPPGGFNSEDGIPVLLNESAFKVFVICDSLALCLSMLTLTPLLMSLFPRIYSSRLAGRLEKHIYTLLSFAFLMTMCTFLTGVYLLVFDEDWWLEYISVILVLPSQAVFIVPIWGLCRLIFIQLRLRVRRMRECRCAMPSFIGHVWGLVPSSLSRCKRYTSPNTGFTPSSESLSSKNRV